MTHTHTAQSKAIDAARAIACKEVARRWPELAGIEPTVSPRPLAAPRAGQLRELGAAEAPPSAPPTIVYTFTFAGKIRTPEGYTMPRVARVTVDSNQRIIKAVSSK